ncbi:MAG: radical SAM protein, partial [Candidatus Helarchaeota archaeon]
STKPCEVSSGIKKTTNGCPYDCGICENHKSAPCICLIDVTNRCNLACPICFANANAKGYVVEPSFEDVVKIMEHFRSMKPQPAVLLQFAGGEPSLREDLPDIIRKGKELGFIEAMISTNGIRMAKSIDLCREYSKAGLDAVYLQFDATDAPEVWKKVRGVNLWKIKQKVIENCRQINNEGDSGHLTVMLVPVIAKGVNDHQVGNILEFAKENSDVIGGVVFQPVSLCGRINYEELMELRYTTSDLKVDINKATNNAITKFYPLALTAKLTKLLAWFDDVPAWAPVSHQDCGFATICVINDKGELDPIENYFEVEGFIRWTNKVWDMVSNKESPKPTSLLKGINLADFGAIASTVGKFIDDMTNLGYRQMIKAYYFAGALRYIKPAAFTSKTFRSFSRLVFTPNLTSAGNFFLSKNMLISAMHFQDAYNFDLQRVSHCLVHYGIVDPEDSSRILEIPFCAMNTIHRERIEKALAIPGEKTEKPEVITERITNYVNNLE